MMRSAFGRMTRRSLAFVVVVAYGCPLLIPLVVGTVHAAEHSVQILAAERTRLAEAGLLHGFAGPTQSRVAADVAAARTAAAGGYLHEHDGAWHAHDGLLGEALEIESADVDELEEDALVVAFAMHLPAPAGGTFAPMATRARGPTAIEHGLASPRAVPPLPPPKA